MSTGSSWAASATLRKEAEVEKCGCDDVAVVCQPKVPTFFGMKPTTKVVYFKGLFGCSRGTVGVLTPISQHVCLLAE